MTHNWGKNKKRVNRNEKHSRTNAEIQSKDIKVKLKTTLPDPHLSVQTKQKNSFKTLDKRTKRGHQRQAKRQTEFQTK